MSACIRLFIRLTDKKKKKGGEKETTFLLDHREALLEKTVLVLQRTFCKESLLFNGNLHTKAKLINSMY